MKRLFSLVLLLTVGLTAGCDGGGPDLVEAPSTTVAFGTAELSVLEADNPTIELPVVLNTPVDSPVRVEVLFAKAASGENFTLADIGITEPDESRAFYNDEGELTAYVVGAVTFPADAEAGTVRTVSVNIADSTVEGQEVGLFALQSAASEGGEIEVEAPSEFTLTIAAEGTETLVEEDFVTEGGEGTLGVFTSTGSFWGASSQGDPPSAPYAVANAFESGEANDYLISPPLDFTSVADETLTFINARAYDDPEVERGLQVLISTTYDGSGDPDLSEFTDISDRVTFAEEGTFFEFVESGEVDLSDEEFQADEVYIAFRYLSGPGENAVTWEIDNVTVTGRTLVE